MLVLPTLIDESQWTNPPVPTPNLDEIEATYSSVFEHAGAAAIIVDADMTIIKANAKFEQLTGYDRSEIDGCRRWPEFVHPDYVDMMKDFHVARRTGQGNPPTEYECKVIDGQGTVRDIAIKAGMIPGTQRSVLSFMDITARKDAERALIQSNREIREIIDMIDGYVYTCSEDLRIEFMNQRLIERTGRDATGDYCYRVLHGLEKPCPFCVNDRVFQGETVRWEIQSPKDHRWFYCVNTPVFKDGRVIRKQSVIIDITEKNQAEEKLEKENLILKESFRGRSRFGRIVGQCSRMQEVYQNIVQAAATDSPVIIYGESGTGKELVARAIHEMSDRRKKAFIAVNCGAIPPNLLESEFFGHVPGAFTGAEHTKKGYLEVADRGTLFLDEIGEIEMSLQPKLLRAIDGGGYTPVGAETLKHPDARIIAATNRNLQQMVSQGRMRSDFFYRVHVIPIYLPPLRERTGDLPLLIDDFMGKIDPRRARPIDSRVMDQLLGHHWPGNVRELQNALRQYVALGHLKLTSTEPSRDAETLSLEENPPSEENGNLQDLVKAYEKKVISLALRRHRWHRSNAAESLGINRRTLFKKLKQHRLD